MRNLFSLLLLLVAVNVFAQYNSPKLNQVHQSLMESGPEFSQNNSCGYYLFHEGTKSDSDGSILDSNYVMTMREDGDEDLQYMILYLYKQVKAETSYFLKVSMITQDPNSPTMFRIKSPSGVKDYEGMPKFHISEGSCESSMVVGISAADLTSFKAGTMFRVVTSSGSHYDYTPPVGFWQI